MIDLRNVTLVATAWGNLIEHTIGVLEHCQGMAKFGDIKMIGDTVFLPPHPGIRSKQQICLRTSKVVINNCFLPGDSSNFEDFTDDGQDLWQDFCP